jgi:hypothetical protein
MLLIGVSAAAACFVYFLHVSAIPQAAGDDGMSLLSFSVDKSAHLPSDVVVSSLSTPGAASLLEGVGLTVLNAAMVDRSSGEETCRVLLVAVAAAE